MKSNIASKLTLRAKFKSFDMVEVCIINSETGEIQLEEIPLRLGREFPKEEADKSVLVNSVKESTPSAEVSQQDTDDDVEEDESVDKEETTND